MLVADRPSGRTVRPPAAEAEAPGEPALTTLFGAVGTVMSKMMDEREAFCARMGWELQTAPMSGMSHTKERIIGVNGVWAARSSSAPSRHSSEL